LFLTRLTHCATIINALETVVVDAVTANFRFQHRRSITLGPETIDTIFVSFMASIKTVVLIPWLTIRAHTLSLDAACRTCGYPRSTTINIVDALRVLAGPIRQAFPLLAVLVDGTILIHITTLRTNPGLAQRIV